MTLARTLCQSTLDEVVARAGLEEAVEVPLVSAMQDAPVGVLRTWSGGKGVAKAVYCGLTVEAIGLDSHMVFAFTDTESLVPHFTLDSVFGQGSHAFHLDLIPRAELASTLKISESALYRKLRQHGLVAARLTVFFHTNRHKPDRPQYSATRTITLHPMTSDSLELIHAARRGAEHAWREGYGISKAGIMLDDLVAAELRPRTLFEGDTDRRDRLMGALDEINGRFGKFAAVPASQGFRRDWKARSDMKSPNYTTQLAEVPRVRAG